MRVFRLLTVVIPSFSPDDFLCFFLSVTPAPLTFSTVANCDSIRILLCGKRLVFRLSLYSFLFLLLNFNSFSFVFPPDREYMPPKGKNKTLKKKQTQTHRRCVAYNNVTKRFLSFAIVTQKKI